MMMKTSCVLVFLSLNDQYGFFIEAAFLPLSLPQSSETIYMEQITVRSLPPPPGILSYIQYISKDTANDQNCRGRLAIANTMLVNAGSFDLPTTVDDINSFVWNNYQKLDFSSDRVVRVLDDDAGLIIKLEKLGLVSMAGVKSPKPYDTSSLTDCPNSSVTTASTKLKQLLPPNTHIKVHVTQEAQNRRPAKAIILLQSKYAAQSGDNELAATSVQEELIRRGFVKNKPSSLPLLPLLNGENYGEILQHRWVDQQDKFALLSQSKNRCVATESPPLYASGDFNVDKQFEPMRTLRPQASSDSDTSYQRPDNPGDTKGCSDFATYEDALSWYERYFPWYGDVARLDRDGDGVPCPGLVHTKDPERYRMKNPSTKSMYSSH